MDEPMFRINYGPPLELLVLFASDCGDVVIVNGDTAVAEDWMVFVRMDPPEWTMVEG